MSGFLAGKRVLVVGLASNRSIAYGIANAMHEQGARLALSYQTEKLKPRVEDMGKKWDAELCVPCDVSNDEEINQVFDSISKLWDGIDVIVHSVGYAPADQLEGDYIDCVTREGFSIAHDISSYSFSALAKAGLPLLKQSESASMLTLSYLGAEKAVPNYNVMGLAKASLEANVRYLASSIGKYGIRVNGISAGPIKTLAASGIKSFRNMLNFCKDAAPLKRNVSIKEVGDTAAFLSSDMASGITGEIIHVDAGYHCAGLAGLVSTPSEKS